MFIGKKFSQSPCIQDGLKLFFSTIRIYMLQAFIFKIDK